MFIFEWYCLFYSLVAYLTTTFSTSYYRSVDLWNDLRFGVYMEGNRRCSFRHLFTMFLESHGKSTEIHVWGSRRSGRDSNQAPSVHWCL